MCGLAPRVSVAFFIGYISDRKYTKLRALARSFALCPYYRNKWGKIDKTKCPQAFILANLNSIYSQKTCALCAYF